MFSPPRRPRFLNVHLNPFGARRQGRDCSLITGAATRRRGCSFLQLEERQSHYQSHAGSAALCVCFLLVSGFWCLECSFKKAPTPPALCCGTCVHARTHGSQASTKTWDALHTGTDKMPWKTRASLWLKGVCWTLQQGYTTLKDRAIKLLIPVIHNACGHKADLYLLFVLNDWRAKKKPTTLMSDKLCAFESH